MFLTLYPDTAASPRYRVMQYLPYLRAQGVECTVVHALSPRQHRRLTGTGRNVRAAWYHIVETPRRLVQLLRARRYDVAFVQKAIMTAYLRGADELLRRCAKHVVYDIDDAVHLAPPHPLRSVWKRLEDRNQIARIFSISDLVVAGNDWLRDVARDAGARAETLPTVVDTDRFVPNGETNGVYRVGWIGGPSTTDCLEPVAGTLDSIESAEVELVGADPQRVPFSGADVRPWSRDDEVRMIQRFSVGIMPLQKNEWTRGKCALKALQYMACGVPCVATPYGAVTGIIRDGENGFFADTPDAWRAALEKLRDPALRKRIGEAGRATVEKKYSLSRTAPRMNELLESVL